MNITEYNIFIRDKNYEVIKNFLTKEIINNDIVHSEDFLHIARDFTLFQIHEFDAEIQNSIELLFLSKKYKNIIDLFYDIKNSKIYIDIFVMKAFYKLGEIEKSISLKNQIFENIKKEKFWNLCPLYFKAIEETFSSIGLLNSKVEYLVETSLYEDVELYILNKIDSKVNTKELDLALETVKEGSIYLYEKLSLYRKVKNQLVSTEEKVKALILFHDKKLTFLTEDNKLKVSIHINEERELLTPSINIDKKDEDKEEKQKLVYIKSKEEESLITRLRHSDPIFENYNRDLALSFINLEMYELLVLYIGNFEQTLDRLYLKLEALLRTGKYSHVIDEVNSRVKNESIAFKYLKALAYKEMGFKKKARNEFKEIASKDSRFRKVREFLDES